MAPRAIALAACLLAAGPSGAQQPPAGVARPPDAADAATEPALTPAWIDLSVNGVPKGQCLARLAAGDVWLSADDLARSGITGAGGDRVVLGGRSMVSVRSLAPAVTFAFDEEDLLLRLSASGAVLGRSALDLAPRQRPGRLARGEVPAAFLNLGGRADDWERATASAELGASLGPALLLSSASWSTALGVVRGPTMAQLDDEARLVRYRAGEFFAAPGDPLGGATLLLGAGAGREFSLDPYAVREPFPRTSVFVPTPSTLEVWVGDRLVRRVEVLPGTLDLENLPTYAGENEVRTVLRDAFGRESTASTNFLMGSNLLGPGLSDWSVAAGLPGGVGADGALGYRQPLAMGRYRLGVNRLLTIGARAELGQEVVNGGLLLGTVTPLGNVEVAAAASRAGRGGGAAAFTWRTPQLRQASVAAQVRLMSDRYATTSLPAAADRGRVQALLSAAVAPARQLSLQLEGAVERRRDGGTSRRGSARAVWILGPGRQLSMTGSRSLHGVAGDSWEVMLAFASRLPGRHTAQVAARTGGAGESAWGSVTRAAGSGTGVGYHAEGQAGDDAYVAADVTGQASFGRAALRERWSAGVPGGRANHETVEASTGLVWIDGELYLSRPVEESFTLVVLDGAEGVLVTRDGQPVGRTDRSGRLLVTDLIPYYGNRIRLRDADLPLDFRVNEVERFVAPRHRAGSVERFDVGRARVIVGRVMLAVDARDVAPEWGEIAVELPSGRVVSPIGTDGSFWLEGLLPGRAEALVRWEGRLCRFTLEVGAETGIVDVGLQRCTQMLAAGGDGPGILN